jgi:hypothetical protein
MKIADRVVARFTREAASPIDLKDLPPVQQKLVKILTQHNLKPTMAWDGIHGYIVEFDGGQGAGRFTVELLKKLVGHPLFRWIEGNHAEGISVGM